MRLHRFIPFVRDLVVADASPVVSETRTFEELGDADRRFGLMLRFSNDARVFLQAVAISPPGGNPFSEPERIEHGEPPAAATPYELQTMSGRVRIVDVEGYLLALIANSGNTEIKALGALSADPVSTKPAGVEVVFHNGAKSWLYFLHALRAGEEPSASSAFKPLEAV
ncbi:hypothetical protein [Allonocardiopsis opalescens]|uniref:Uncharacterized protein n=1 Tax=Allonocardiopsis opalescens TaxID=1144618 RepID=A0A2T0QC16_9ACTN|nr:hypothetical protein [Allonocardiopsis opalescens]PRY01421.1 hypothetical protein CLV72_1013 [Allonocardiopsis opalescens]